MFQSTSKLPQRWRRLSFAGTLAFLAFLVGCGGTQVNVGTGTTTNYQLTVQAAGTGAGAVSSTPTGISCGKTCSASFTGGSAVTLTATPAAGSTFAGWSGGCTGTGTCAVTLTANASVTATFNPAEVATLALTVTNAGTGTGTVTSAPTGINCGTACTANFASGSAVTLTATPATGSTFAGWSGACTGTATCSVTLNAAATVTATFTALIPHVQLMVLSSGTGTGTITSAPAGINCGTICSGSFPTGTSVTLTAAPNSTSTFAGWSGACTGTSPCVVNLTANSTVTATFTAIPPPIQLTVVAAGTGTGTVASAPAGITCGSTCNAGFPTGTQVTLTATPATGSVFIGWSGGACTGQSTCALTLTDATSVTATFNVVGTINVINHVIMIGQENRSLDNMFGAMREYWAQNNIPDQSFDGLPQFNPKKGIAPLYGAPPALPGCNPADPAPTSDCVWDPTNLVTSFHFKTVCNENTSPSWSEAHVDWNYYDQVGKYPPAKNNGFVFTAAHDARTNPVTPFYDVNGIRAMGYWDGTDLNYSYFMASQFATSDRFFQPAMSRTNINREYLAAATSGGYVYPNGFDVADTPQLMSKTIYEDMDDAGVSWKLYVDTDGTGCSTPYQESCLINTTYLENFTYAQHVLTDKTQHIFPLSDYYSDLINGTLPQFAEIEPASDAALDEHGSDYDAYPENVQAGEAQIVAAATNALMATAGTANNYWSDSAIFFTYDESGGMYDHVPPQPAVSPDGIAPLDLTADTVCYSETGPTCNFTWTGYRIPLIVISAYAKKNYVSHTVMDSTAILKFVETRFNMPPLNARDAAQPDMTEFFDFNNPVWMAPPTPPSQNVSNPCYLDKLP